MPQGLANKQADTITDAEVAEFVASVSANARVRAIEVAGRDALGRAMVLLDAEGAERGTYSVGRAIAIIYPPTWAQASVAPPAAAHAALFAKRYANQLTDGELEAVAEYSIIHPHISIDAAQAEELRREDMPGRRTGTGRVPKVHDRGYVGSPAQIDWAAKIKPAMLARIRACHSMTHEARDVLCAHIEAKRSAKDLIEMSKGKVNKALREVLSEFGVAEKNHRTWSRQHGAEPPRSLS